MESNPLPSISVIIPVLNEEENLKKLIPYLKAKAASPEHLEIIVVDGGSTDPSLSIAKSLNAISLSSPKGRARQMNTGARSARGRVLYFLHADSFPPEGYDQKILKGLEKNADAGCFRLQFDSKSLFLRFFAWFSRFNFPICRGGDQSLFITRDLFEKLGGFDERYRVYEDNELTGRIYRKANFRVLPHNLLTSMRKYRLNGRLRLQYHFAFVHYLHFRGKGPEVLNAYYERNVKQA